MELTAVELEAGRTYQATLIQVKALQLPSFEDPSTLQPTLIFEYGVAVGDGMVTVSDWIRYPNALTNRTKLYDRLRALAAEPPRQVHLTFIDPDCDDKNTWPSLQDLRDGLPPCAAQSLSVNGVDVLGAPLLVTVEQNGDKLKVGKVTSVPR